MKAELSLRSFFLAFLGLVLFNLTFAETLTYLCPPWATPPDDLVTTFEEQTGVKLVIQVKTSVKAIQRYIEKVHQNDEDLPDVFFTGGGSFSVLQKKGFNFNLSNMIPEAILANITHTEPFIVEGQLYGLPLYQQMVMIDYDLTALNALGITAKEINTWEQFESFLAELKNQGIYQYPYAAGSLPWAWYLIVLSSGATLFDNDLKPTFNRQDNPAYHAFKRITDWYKNGYIDPDRLIHRNPHPNFWAGKAAIHQAFEGSLSIGNNPEKSKVAPNARYLLLPNQHNTWRIPAGVAVSKDSKNPKLAIQWIEFLLDKRMQTHLYDQFGLSPINQTVLNTLIDNGRIEGIDTIQKQAGFIVSLPYDQPWFDTFETYVNIAMINVITGIQNLDEALQALADQAYQLQNQ